MGQTDDVETIKEDAAVVFETDSSLSRHSYASATNYHHQSNQDEYMRKYIGKHPLSGMMNGTRWNNVPLPLR